MWVTPEQIENARQTDLLTYLQTYEPDNLQKLGNGTYCTKEHDSLKISNGLWHWFSRHIGGKNALDYLIKVRGFSFTQAVMMLGTSAPAVQKFAEKEREPKTLELPKLHPDIQRVKQYLTGRGIDERVIDYCHKEGLLFEDDEYHNCVFVGKDEEGIPRYGALRSTMTDFKRDLDGSDKRYSFKICPNEGAEILHVFEAVIDLMSYITLAGKARSEWYTDDYLSLGGVYATDKKQDIPLALNSYLESHPHTKTVRLHLDNDEIGKKAAEQIKEALQDNYTVCNEPPKSGKDYNEYLQNQIRKRKEPER
jgi:hypothetical protein